MRNLRGWEAPVGRVRREGLARRQGSNRSLDLRCMQPGPLEGRLTVRLLTPARGGSAGSSPVATAAPGDTPWPYAEAVQFDQADATTLPSMREVFGPSGALLGELGRFAVGMDRQFGFLPADDSGAMRELACEEVRFVGRSNWLRPVKDAHSFGGVTLLATGDYVRSYAALLQQEETPVYGHLAVARGAMEAAGVCHWLNDPSIGTEERVKRALSERLYSARELGRFKVRREQSQRQLAEIRATATALGWSISGSGSRAAEVNSVGRPSTPRQLSDLLVGDGAMDIGNVLWCYLSSALHATWWGLIESVVEAPEETTHSFVPATVAFGTRSNSVNAQTLCVARLCRVACEARMTLMGWSSAAWSNLDGRVRRLESDVLRSVARSRVS